MSEKNFTTRALSATQAPRRPSPARNRLRPSPARARLRRASKLPLLLAALLIVCAPPAAPRARAQAKPNIAGDVEDAKKRATERKATERTSPKPSGEARPAPARRRHAPSSARGPSATAAASSPLEVTFYAGMADADFYLHAGGQMTMQKLGRADSDGRLVTRLQRGTHTVTASRPGARIHRQQIDVRPGNTTFVFNLSGAPAGEAVGAGASAVATTAEGVFRRYLDPRQTDGVTVAEWQLAQAQTAAAFAANPLEPQTEAQALFARGQLAFLRRDYPAALVAFNAAALKVPTSALAYYGLGNAYLANNQTGEAARAYGRAAELEPRLAMAHKGMGDVLARQNKNKEALRHYERARILGYTSSATSQVTARILLKERRWQQALKELLEVSKASPSADVFVGIGDAYVGLGQPLSAAPAYRRAVELDPKSALAHYKFGELAYAQREYAAAVESLERALALDPAGALINRGRARELAGKAGDRLRAMR